MAAVATTLVIDFGNTDAGSIMASLDSKRNSGRATFKAGDTIFFRVYAQVAYTCDATAGSVSKVTTESETILDEIITFARSTLANTTVFVKNLISQSWLGRSHGNLVASGYNNINIQTPTTETPIGVAKVSYTSEYDVWQLNAPNFSGDKFTIVVAVVANS